VVRGSNPLGPSEIVGSGESVVSRVETTNSDGFEHTLDNLSKDKLVRLISAASRVRKRKYQRKKDSRHGTLNRGFTEAELARFFKCCTHPKAHLAFTLMAYLGLRVGEVVTLKIEDIDFPKRKLRVQTLKAHTADFLHLHDGVHLLLNTWVQKHYKTLLERKYLLFSDNPMQKREHISPHWLRKEFRQVCILANFNEWYAKAHDETNPIRRANGEPRKLYRLTTHSLRHYFITKVYKTTKDPIKCQRLARHRSLKSTQVYIHTTQEELDEAMDVTFDVEQQIDARELKQALVVLKMLKRMGGS